MYIYICGFRGLWGVLKYGVYVYYRTSIYILWTYAYIYTVLFICGQRGLKTYSSMYCQFDTCRICCRGIFLWVLNAFNSSLKIQKHWSLGIIMPGMDSKKIFWNPLKPISMPLQYGFMWYSSSILGSWTSHWPYAKTRDWTAKWTFLGGKWWPCQFYGALRTRQALDNPGFIKPGWLIRESYPLLKW